MLFVAKLTAAAGLACVLGSAAAQADEISALRRELDTIKLEYSTRIATLEKRIAELEAQAAVAAQAAATTPPPPPSAPSGQAAGTGTAFNPAMSVILAGTYSNLSEDPATYRIAGFIPAGPGVGPGTRSFNLGESELTLSANVDPYFFANLTASIRSDDTISVEEAFFRTTALSHGFTVKGGRFFAGVGYLNEIHAHAWDFIDQPLIYQAFFDSQLAEDGIQVKWLAPTDLFVEIGAETGNGDRYPGTQRNRNGANGGAVFVHLGNDVGDSGSWRAGVSFLDRDADNRNYQDVDAAARTVTDAFTGTSRTWVADASFKWAPHGNPTVHSLKVQGEYMHRTESGVLAFDTTGTNLGGDFKSTQSGWYLQGVYQFRPRWRVGIRYDSLDSGSSHIGLVDSGAISALNFPVLAAASPHRITGMTDWSLSEFSRLRAQFALDQARAAVRDRQFFLQYLFSVGAHGAHKF
jgi:hypothetical protein